MLKRTLALICAFGLAPMASGAETPTFGPATPDVVYVLQTMDGNAFAARATMTFPEPGRVAGNAPCNIYSGALEGDYPAFQPGPMIVSRMACPDLDAETAFLTLLAEIRSAEVSGATLTLSDDTGQARMVFEAE